MRALKERTQAWQILSKHSGLASCPDSQNGAKAKLKLGWDSAGDYILLNHKWLKAGF